MNEFENALIFADVCKTIELIPTEEERAAAALALLRYGSRGIKYEGDNILIQVIMQ